MVRIRYDIVNWIFQTGMKGSGMKNITLDDFTRRIASKEPVPGGGGASALVAAVGIALGDMVGELTVGKKKYADVEEDIKLLMQKAQNLRGKLLDCINKDAQAFEPLSKAYSIPKDDPSRDEVMERCLKDAAAAPLEIFEVVCESIELQKEFAQKGSKIVVSDAATGVAILKGAMYGAAVNVKVNTKLMKDREEPMRINNYLDEKIDTYSKLSDEIFNNIYGGF